MKSGTLASVKAGVPCAARALQFAKAASTVGFDWNDPRAVLAKIREEADEIEAALDARDAKETGEEVGDLLFAVVNLARHAGADPETVLSGTNAKFERRFASIEAALAAQGRRPCSNPRWPRWMRCGTRRQRAEDKVRTLVHARACPVSALGGGVRRTF